MLSEDEVRALRGLDEADAEERLSRDGPNELPSPEARGVSAVVAEVASEPMILLLAGCAAVYLLLGDRQQALALVASVAVVIGISVYQTEKTERALAALRDLASPRALVIREGRERRVPGRAVAHGDLLVLGEGDRVAADGVLLWSANLRIDESLLTGESVPVAKAASDETAVYSGTLVVAGHGIARVTATGSRTALGRIGRALERTAPSETALERQMNALVRIVAVAGAAVCLAVAVGYGMGRRSWLEGLLAGLALAMSMVPEEFPVILTLFLALGAWRISRRNVLVRRMPALEALGAITVLCVDKTGTLTENRMAASVLSTVSARHLLTGGASDGLPEEFHRLLEFAVLASQQSPFDPMERAINEVGRTQLAGTEHLHRTWRLVREYPLSPALLAMSQVWRAVDRERWVVAAKGAPEAVADLCHVDAPRAEAILAETAALAGQGLRVLAVAGATVDAPELPPSQHDFPFEFLGLVGLADPVRPTARGAVAECRRAGIRTVMITGDYPGTARRIAADVGLPAGNGILTGADLDAMDDAELARRIAGVDVFARVVPEQKLRLVHALRAGGAVVAMGGDGVNDAPALRAADVGVAMGGRGTDVAREAADLVLIDDDFSSIAAAIRLGRRVYDNLRKAVGYVVSIHVPIAGLALLPVVLGWPLVLLPVHIALLELIIDPACSVVFEAEPEEPDVMARRPRARGEPLLGARAIAWRVGEGVLVLLVAAASLAVAVRSGFGEPRARLVAFSTVLIGNLGLILANRSGSAGVLRSLGVQNRALWWVVGGALAILVASLTVPGVRDVLRLAAPSLRDLALVAAAGAAALGGLALLKGAERARSRQFRGES